MRLTILIAITAVVGFGHQAAVARERKTVLTAYVLGESFAPSLVTIAAEAQAGKMFADIGVSIQFRSGQPHAPLPLHFVIVEIGDQTPKDLYPGALAYARPYDRIHIKVFYDRVHATVHSQTVPALLAHVLVHEIAHVLQGFSRHSDEGIMKAHWDANDYLVMQSKRLSFTQKDIDFIRLGLATREAQPVSQGRGSLESRNYPYETGPSAFNGHVVREAMCFSDTQSPVIGITIAQETTFGTSELTF
jgi:hypothetical protein